MSLRGDILKLVGFATNKGYVTNVVNAAGVSPSQAPVAEILRVDLQNEALATTSVEELLELPFLKEIDDTLKAYQYSKRCNVLGVMYEATR